MTDIRQLELFNIMSGEQLRANGISTAIDHADVVHELWSERAYQFLLNYLSFNSSFMVEDVREASKDQLPEPPSLMAWGGVVVRAAKEGLIKRIGFRNVKNEKAHATPASVWMRI